MDGRGIAVAERLADQAAAEPFLPAAAERHQRPEKVLCVLLKPFPGEGRDLIELFLFALRIQHREVPFPLDPADGRGDARTLGK